MFRELMAAWRKTDPLKDMYRGLLEMVETCEWMFSACWKAGVDGKISPDVKEEIYRRDINVNKAERNIRRHIVEHLAVQPGVDVPACLILMSVVKDAERLGDYCKNILDAAELLTGPLSECGFFKTFDELNKEILSFFGKTRKAIADSDEMLAQEVIVEERDAAGRCDTLVERIASEDLPAKEAVPWALIARYLKRISAHLGNIASSLVMPVHKLDYYDEKYLKGQEPE
jgi:phosphate uptake regulator